MNQDEAVAILIKYRVEQANKAIEDALCLEAGNGSPAASLTAPITPCFMPCLPYCCARGNPMQNIRG